MGYISLHPAHITTPELSGIHARKDSTKVSGGRNSVGEVQDRSHPIGPFISKLLDANLAICPTDHADGGDDKDTLFFVQLSTDSWMLHGREMLGKR